MPSALIYPNPITVGLQAFELCLENNLDGPFPLYPKGLNS